MNYLKLLFYFTFLIFCNVLLSQDTITKDKTLYTLINGKINRLINNDYQTEYKIRYILKKFLRFYKIRYKQKFHIVNPDTKFDNCIITKKNVRKLDYIFHNDSTFMIFYTQAGIGESKRAIVLDFKENRIANLVVIKFNIDCNIEMLIKNGFNTNDKNYDIIYFQSGYKNMINSWY